jgi:hypothetical protein
MGLIAVADDPELAVRYNTLNIDLSQHPERHRDSTQPFLYDSGDCDLTGVEDFDFHDVGVPLQQAIWEILWNQNCAPDDPAGDSCPTGLATFGNDLFDATFSRDEVIDTVGFALARSLVLTRGTGPTFDEILFWFLVRIEVLTDQTTRDNVERVLLHHNFTPSL